VVADVLGALGHGGGSTRAEQWFRRLADAVAAFTGMSYRALGDSGAMIGRAG
jgi:hypothetical protein